MPEVSVIIPVYKTEQYLERCVRSVQNQTLSDIEIILVDDGSPDRCPMLCDELAKNDSRIRVIHKKNGGASSARNAGLRAATGKYVGYIDSDDYAEKNMYEVLLQCAQQKHVDFVMADYWRLEKDKREAKTLDIRSGLYKKKDIENEIYPMLIMQEKVECGPLLSLWNCLYNRKFIVENNLFFQEDIKCGEDFIYSSILGYKATSFFYLKNQYIYNYIQNNNSVTTSFKPSSWEVYCKMNEKMVDFFAGKDAFDFNRQLKLHMIYFGCSYMNSLKYTDYNFIEKYKVRKKVLNDEHLISAFKKLTLPDVNWKFRLILFLMKYRMAFILTMIGRYRHE